VRKVRNLLKEVRRIRSWHLEGGQLKSGGFHLPELILWQMTKDENLVVDAMDLPVAALCAAGFSQSDATVINMAAYALFLDKDWVVSMEEYESFPSTVAVAELLWLEMVEAAFEVDRQVSLAMLELVRK
jgi:hypothetical protein